MFLGSVSKVRLRASDFATLSSVVIRHSSFVLLFCLPAVRASADGRKLELQLPGKSPEVFERIEICVAGMPTASNPFDPQSVALDLETTAPSGKRLVVPGFFCREFDRNLEGHREALTPRGDGDWRIRWLPLEAGRHTLVVTATAGGQRTATGEAVIEVSAGKRPGLVRVEPAGKRYFRLDDGTPLFLNGLCACWYGSRGTYDYDDWLESYHNDVVAWHADMGRRLRSIDPCRHLISSSFTGGSQRPDLFALPEMDFAQYHSYNEQHPAGMTAERAASFFEKYGKPFFVSEYGTDWKGWKLDTDPAFSALHQAIWSGAVTGAAGTGMTWWWEQIHTANLFHHWSALAAFLAGTGMGRTDLRPARWEHTEGPLIPYGVASHDEALVWLLDRASDWPSGALEVNPRPSRVQP